MTDGSGSSKTIGALVQGIVSSLHPEDGMTDASASRPKNSATTTSAGPTPGLIGRLPGGSGSSDLTLSLPTNPTAVLRDPLRWMPASVSGSIVETTRDVIDFEYGFERVMTGYRLARRIDPEARLEAQRVLRAVLAPGQLQDIVTQLEVLGLVVVGDRDPRQVAVYAKKLQAVPAAALALAIDDWVAGERGKYWPSLAELLALIEHRLQPAQRLLEALK